MTEERAWELLVSSLENLKTAGMLQEDVKIDPEMILLGVGSTLDSIGFVTFVTDLEEKIMDETNKDLYLVLNEIDQFNISLPYLKAGALAKYIVKLSEGE